VRKRLIATGNGLRSSKAIVGADYFGGEGEIRTHETREGLPVFKSDGSQGSGTHSHAIAIVADSSREARTL
jgi:hypothetical protein